MDVEVDMSRLEIHGLHTWRNQYHYPFGMNIIEKLWWRFMPGVIINVPWPTGKIVVNDQDPRWVDLGGAVWVELESSDPNDHYRPELEQMIGRQGWDWNWGLTNNDATTNRLTIKIRQKYAKHATMLALRWT